MAFSLEELWKNSSDDEIRAAVDKWDTLNERAQRAVRTEVKDRRLDIAVPECAVAPARASSPAPAAFTPKTLLLIAGVFALLVALAVVVG